MEFILTPIAFLAPIAFVFALAAISQVGSLKKDIAYLKSEIEKLKK
ncbi:hypothetical protein [Heliorestis acidaminivorans]|nr:hypothetical protein [Heliorestis acidaminivorans]